MSYTIETYTKDEFKVTIGYDESHWMYDELWHGVTFISNYRDYINQGKHDEITVEEVLNGDIPDGLVVVPITAYIHGRIALTAGEGNSYPFNCRWDSGTFGFLLFEEGEFGDNNCGVEGFVRHWQAVLNGDIYYFTIEDEDEVLESCGGFDDLDYMKEEVDSILKGMLEYKEKQRVEKLKAQIKHRVPLHRRAV